MTHPVLVQQRQRAIDAFPETSILYSKLVPIYPFYSLDVSPHSDDFFKASLFLGRSGPESRASDSSIEVLLERLVVILRR